jgi:hypothetical protein
MDADDLEELFRQAGGLARALSRGYREVTGEELDLEGAIRHYPLLALGLAAGAGVIAGWWLGRREAQQLPPPKPAVSAERPFNPLRELRARWTGQSPMKPGDAPAGPMEYLERILPESMETVRKVLPEVSREEAAEIATAWIDTVLQPRLKQGLDNLASTMPDSGVGAYLKERLQRPKGSEDQPPEDASPPD